MIFKYIFIVLLVLAYWACSIGLTFYNKHLFHKWDVPLAATSIHFMVTFVLAGWCRKIRQCVTGKSSILVDWKTFSRKVIPTAIASAFDIGFSNWSLVYITVPLYTMVKSTSILFILACALLFKLETWDHVLIAVISLISVGLFLFVFKGGSDFNLFGFLLCLTAAACGGFRWTLSQILTQKKELGLENPIDAIFHLQPAMVIAMAPLLIAHGLIPFLTTEKLFGAELLSDLFPNATKLLAGAFIAFALGLTEYLLVAKTSSLTLSLSGIIKELITMLVAEMYEEDTQLTKLNWIGFVVCVSGIVVHTVNKYQKSRNEKSAAPAEYLELDHSDKSPLLESDENDEDVIFAT